MIKAILLDIDGTLTNSEKKITPKTYEALMKAQQAGIKLVIASGRPTKGLYQYGDQLKMQDYHGLFVSYNGARVSDCTNDEVLVDVTIDPKLVHDVLLHLQKFHVRPMITYQDHMLVEDCYDCMIQDGERTFNVLQYESRMNGYRLMEVERLVDFVNFPVNKILTAADSLYLRENFEQMAKPFEGKLSMMFTSNFYFEYTALGIDKGRALEKAMAKLGIRPEECIAFGDAENDISMLEFAGIGVCMANGQEKVKDIADEITFDHDHDGIAHSLQKHLPQLF